MDLIAGVVKCIVINSAFFSTKLYCTYSFRTVKLTRHRKMPDIRDSAGLKQTKTIIDESNRKPPSNDMKLLYYFSIIAISKVN